MLLGNIGGIGHCNKIINVIMILAFVSTETVESMKH